MKKLYKFLIISIIFVLILFNMTVFANEDIIESKHWAQDVMSEFISKEYIISDVLSENLDNEITKGEMTEIINKFFSYGSGESRDENLKIAEQKGYLYNSKVDEKITREEVAVLICKVMSLTAIEESSMEFIDDNEIAVWSKGYVYSLVKEGIIVGFPDQSYKPQKNISVAEFITILNRCTGIGGSDFELIDTELTNIEVSVLDSSDGMITLLPIDKSITMVVGDKINLAIALPIDCESELVIEAENKEIIEFIEEFSSLSALKKGESSLTFKSKLYEKTIEIIVE